MLLEIENLGVEVAGKRVLKDINLSIAEGETHVLLGPNGAGKSTLFLTILGFPQYDIVQGSIKFKGQDITKLSISSYSSHIFLTRKLYSTKQLHPETRMSVK